MSLRDAQILYPLYGATAYTDLPISLCATRNGVTRSITFTATQGPPAVNQYGSTALAALRLLTFMLFLLVGATLVLARPSLMTWLLFWYCVSTIPSGVLSDGATSWSPVAYLVVAALYEAVQPMGPALLLMFMLCVPETQAPAGWRRWMFWATAGVSAVALVALLVDMTRNDHLSQLYLVPIAVVITRALFIGVVVVTLARLIAMPPTERPRFGWMAFGIISGVIMEYLRRLPTSNLFIALAATLTVILPLTLMYAILRRHIIDVRFVISRTVVYGIVTTLVIGIITAVDWLTSVYLAQLRIALAIDALVTICLGVALHRTYRLIEDFVDSVIYRRKHEAERYLKRLARTLLRAGRQETVDRALVHDPYERLELSMAALVLKTDGAYVTSCSAGTATAAGPTFDPDHDIVRFVQSERSIVDISDLRRHVADDMVQLGETPAVAVPIFDGDDLLGFCLYGLHRDGTRLDPDELESLETLCTTGAQAYMRIENQRLRALAAR